MSKKTSVINPNEKSYGFVWGLVVILVIIVAVIAYIVVANRNNVSAPDDLNWENTSANIQLDIADNAVVLSSENTTDDSKVVELYEDYSCPHCADLAAATDEDMLSAIEDGTIVVHIRDLNFLDRSQDDGNSTRVGASTYAIANLDSAELYWNFRAMALDHQSTIYSNWDLDDLANAARSMGASEETAQAIADFEYQSEFLDDVSANSELLESKIGNVSSPHVFIDGEQVSSSDLTNWVSLARES